MECPTCGNSQEESSLAQSTNCKSCSQYFRIENGKAVASESGITTTHLSDSSDKPEEKPKPLQNNTKETKQTEKKPPLPLEKKQATPSKKKAPATKTKTVEQPDLFGEEAPKKQEKEASQKKASNNAKPPPPESKKGEDKTTTSDNKTEDDKESRTNYYELDENDKRYVGSDRANRYYSYQGEVKERVIECYECFNTHSIIEEASSSLCPKCGTYISLKDYDINSFWTSTLRTRGDVNIGKKGNIRNVTIFCNNLMVEGALDASADCSGTLTLKSSGRISGKISCMKLVISSGVSVVFEKPVRAVEIEIQGSVIANFKKCEKVILFKKARMEGALETKNLEMHKGATHIGKATIG